MRAQRGRCTVPPIINLGGRWGCVVNVTCRPLYPGKRPVTAGWALLLFRTGREKIKYLDPTGVGTPNRLERSESLYRLQTFQKTISVLIVEYERSFSGMNLRKSPQHAALHSDHVSTSLFARLLWPPLFKFKRDEKCRRSFWAVASVLCRKATWQKKNRAEVLTAIHCGTSYRFPW